MLSVGVGKIDVLVSEGATVLIGEGVFVFTSWEICVKDEVEIPVGCIVGSENIFGQ